MVAALGALRPGIFAGVLALYVGGQLISAAKWALAAGALGFRRRYRDYARFYFIGMFVNLFSPGTVGGDVARSLMLGDGARRALAFASVVFDRASGLVVLIAIGLSALVLRSGASVPAPLAWAAAAIVAVLLLSWLLLPRLAAFVLPVRHRLRRFVLEDLAPLWKSRALLTRVTVVSAAFHLVEVTAQYVLARALGLRVPYSYCLVFHPLVTVAASFPLTIGGLGVRESGYVFLLGLVGVAPARAFAMGLLWSGVVFLGGIGGGVALLLRRPGAPGADAGVTGQTSSTVTASSEASVETGPSRRPGR